MKRIDLKNNIFNYNIVDSFPIGYECWCDSAKIRIGYLPYFGQLVSRETYKNLFYHILLNRKIVSDEDWHEKKLYGCFSFGDGKTTFRMADYRGLYIVGFDEDYHKEIGLYQQDQIKNITGSFNDFCDGTMTGSNNNSFYKVFNGNTSIVGKDGSLRYNIHFDSSRCVPTGERVQGRSIPYIRIIKY